MPLTYLISVIVCTFNRSRLLETCLDSLVTQTADKSLFEIIVVNNNSTDDTQKTVSKFVSKSPNIKIVTERQQGLSHARNRGWREAKAQWVAYIDDDATASYNWITKALDTLSNNTFDAFGGIYLPWYRDGKTVWYLDEYGSNKYYMPDIVTTLSKGLYFAGGNCFFKKKLLVEYNGFSPLLGMSEDKIIYGEETRFQAHLVEKGHTLGWNPELIVLHYVPPYKQKLSWFLKSYYATGRDYWSSVKQTPTVYRIFDLLALSIIKPLQIAPKAIRRLFKREYKVHNVVIDILKPAIRYIGSIISGIPLLFIKQNQKHK